MQDIIIIIALKIYYENCLNYSFGKYFYFKIGS